ncbi:MAG: hypothetical protein GX902_00775 [Lentisphaerae bacterium]|nr:hypothetical protein [Lentisphaerota bacterium]
MITSRPSGTSRKFNLSCRFSVRLTA